MLYGGLCATLFYTHQYMIIFVLPERAKRIYGNSEYLNSLDDGNRFVRLRKALPEENLAGRDVITKHDFWKFYQRGFLPWTKRDTQIIIEYLRHLKALSSILWAPCVWKFIKMDHRLEWGFPHTIEDYIVLSDKFLEKMSSGLQTPSTGFFIKCTGTLIHEQIHVLQRKHPDWFRKLYLSWGFRQTPVYIPPEIERKLLINPDGLSRNWVIEVKGKRYLPLSMVKNHQLVLGEIESINGRDMVTKLSQSQIDDYFKSIPSKRQAYHPNEISAHWMTSKILRMIASSRT